MGRWSMALGRERFPPAARHLLYDHTIVQGMKAYCRTMTIEHRKAARDSYLCGTNRLLGIARITSPTFKDWSSDGPIMEWWLPRGLDHGELKYGPNLGLMCMFSQRVEERSFSRRENKGRGGLICCHVRDLAGPQGWAALPC